VGLVFSACSPELAERYLIFGPASENHVPTAVAFPELTNPRRLQSDLFEGFRGGVIGFHPYKEGSRLDIRYSIQDGVAISHDEDGMILWSFGYYLTEIQQVIVDLDVDIDGLFPLRVAYAPDLGTDLTAYTNAAWVCGSEDHLFMVLPDFHTDLVPVGAHQGVVRHEFGHALFGHITTGFSPSCPEYPAHLPGNWRLWSAANEGFADVLATLTLDDPTFMNAALPLESRDVRSDAHVATEALYNESEEYSDPYLAGSVLAAFAWDIREVVGPDIPLQGILAASQRLRALPEERGTEVPLVVLDELALETIRALSDDEEALQAACDALAFRFPDLEAEQCSS
jgi:hypothetical protein